MTNDKILEQVKLNFNEIVKIRRHFHINPELGNKEIETKKYIISCLEKWNIEHFEVLDTAVVGIIKGSEDKVIALRADMDALPIKENTNCDFVSKKDGYMHACGHDLHLAALLGAAKILSENKKDLNGTVKFFFQPDEEGNGGAKQMIEKGVMQNPTVDKVFGIHITPELAYDTVAIKYGQSYASSDIFDIDIYGKSAHGAEPHLGIDSILIASQILTAIQTLVSRSLCPTNSAVITIGKMTGGTVRNAIAKTARLEGIIRTLAREDRIMLKQKLVSLVDGIAASFGATAKVTFTESYDAVINHDEETEFVANCAIDLFGEDKLIVLKKPTMTSEDFGFFLNDTKGSFYHIGVSSGFPLHSDKLLPNENALYTATAMHIKTVCKYLK